MYYATKDYLKAAAIRPRMLVEAEKNIEKAAGLEDSKTIFLSHSHKDEIFAIGLKNILANQGVYVYIDWQDASMPPTPNVNTARNIKKRIRESDHVLVLATNQALSSKWVNWEIGVSDILKTPSRISILPAVDINESFKGTEYLQLYQTVEFVPVIERFRVKKPSEIMGKNLDQWLKNL